MNTMTLSLTLTTSAVFCMSGTISESPSSCSTSSLDPFGLELLLFPPAVLEDFQRSFVM